MKKLATIVAASGLALGLSACGGADNDAEQAVLDFGEAVQDEDFKAICDAFDPEFVKQVEAAGEDCAKMFEDNWDQMGDEVPEDAEMDIQDSEIDGDNATVTVKNDEDKEEDIKLKKVDGDWKISLDGAI